jgi:hypothetical protein
MDENNDINIYNNFSVVIREILLDKTTKTSQMP